MSFNTMLWVKTALSFGLSYYLLQNVANVNQAISIGGSAGVAYMTKRYVENNESTLFGDENSYYDSNRESGIPRDDDSMRYIDPRGSAGGQGKFRLF